MTKKLLREGLRKKEEEGLTLKPNYYLLKSKDILIRREGVKAIFLHNLNPI